MCGGRASRVDSGAGYSPLSPPSASPGAAHAYRVAVAHGPVATLRWVALALHFLAVATRASPDPRLAALPVPRWQPSPAPAPQDPAPGGQGVRGALLTVGSLRKAPRGFLVAEWLSESRWGGAVRTRWVCVLGRCAVSAPFPGSQRVIPPPPLTD